MSRRYDFAMKKGKGRRKKEFGRDFSLKSYGVFQPENGEAIGGREGGDGAASPENEVERQWSGNGLPLTVHSVQVGGTEKSKIGTELVGVTDRIAKLLSDYESLYEDEDESRQALQQSVTGQIYMESLLTDYNTLCQERETLLESLQDSLDLDEEEVLDQLEKTARASIAEFEGSETIVMETFNNAKVTFEKLKGLNQDMFNMSKQGQDTSKLEQEKQMLEDELSMYKRMAVQQRMDNAYKNRRRASVVRRDETQQWKLVAGEMLDIVKGIKNEGKLDKDQLEHDLNNILMTMSNQNELIEKLKADLATSEKKCETTEVEKVKLYRDMKKVQEDLDVKRKENTQYMRMLKKIQAEKKKGAAPVADELLVPPEVELPTTPVLPDMGIQDTAPTDILQAQLRDQKNKAMKFETQNKELQKKIEEFENEARKRREKEMNVAQMVVREKGDKACPNCQILGNQVLSSREEMDDLSAKINKLENELASVRDQLNNAQKEEAKKSRAKGGKKKEEALKPAKGPQTRAPPTPTPEIKETQVQETPAQSPTVESPTVESPVSKSPEEEPTTVRKSARKTKPKKAERKTSSKAKKKATPVKQSEETTKEQTPIAKETKKEEIVEKKKEEPPSEKKAKEEEFSSDEKAPYVKVREAKLMTLCDKGTQTGYLGRMAAMNTVGTGRRESIGSWKATKGERKHSLTDAINAIAPPPVVEQETSIVMSNILEEVDRLCEEICAFMEYGFELVQQQASCLLTQAERHIGVDNAKDLVKETEHDILPSIDRRLSLHVGGGGARRRSTILQLDTRRGSIRNRESLFPAELLARKRADTLPEVEEDSDKMKSPTEHGQQASTLSSEQEGGKEHEQEPTTWEELLKHGISNMAQQAMDIIKGTGEVLSYQLNNKLGTYEKFYEMWRHIRQQRRQSFKPVTGKGILPSVSFEKPVRPSKSRSGTVTEDEDKMMFDPGTLQLPQIAPPVQSQTNKGAPISTAKLSNQGMMMIGSSSTKKPDDHGQAAPNTQQQVRKRGKPMTKQQQVMKQKALLDKVLHVDSRMQDIRNLMVGTSQSIRSSGFQGPQGHFQTGYSSISQSVNLPFIAHGISSRQEAQLPEKRAEAVPRRMSMINEVTQSTSSWSSKEAIPKYHSTNEVPSNNVPPVSRGRARRKLPSLTISNFFK